LEKLCSHNEDVWKRAFTELEYFDPRFAISLEMLMKLVTSTPARQRTVELLSGYKAESLAGQKITLNCSGDGEDYNFIANGSWRAEHKIGPLGAAVGAVVGGIAGAKARKEAKAKRAANKNSIAKKTSTTSTAAKTAAKRKK